MVQTIAMDNLNPLTVVIDFEMASRAAFLKIRPSIQISGFFFNFSQNIWRAVQKIPGYAQRYMTEVEFSTMVQTVIALAFLKPQHVIETYELLTNDKKYRQLDKILNYFEDNYIGRLRNGERTAPRFPILFWNLHARVLNGLPRSTVFQKYT